MVLDLSVPVVLRLYPDAVITGRVTGSDRLPLEHVQVILLHESFQDGTGPRLLPTAFSQTDSHGEYRFRQPPGRYRIQVPYMARAGQEGTTLLPASYPEAQGSALPGTFQVRSSEERRVDLQVRTAESYPVSFSLGQDDLQFNPRVLVRTANGSSFTVFARSSRGQPGQYEVLLPSGSYQLQATVQSRDEENHASQEQAQAAITVAGRPLEGVELHLEPLPAVPLELSFDEAVNAAPSTSAQAQPVRLNILGLRLQRMGAGDRLDGQDVLLTAAGTDAPVVQLEPGSYRLRAQFASSWYVRQASYGGVDLLREPFTVTGRSAEPLRLVLSDDSAILSGTVSGADADTASFVYLLAHQPGLLPVVMVQTSQNGSFTRPLPPGSYTAYAFSHRLAADLTDPDVVRRLGSGTELELSSGGRETVTLPVKPADLP